MRGKVAVLVLVLSFAATVLADDPWKEKPYSEWNLKEISRILNDSPWAKTVRVVVTWSAQRGGGGAAQGGDVESPKAAAGFGSQGEAPFLVRWTSALTVRQALVRGGILEGSLTVPDGEKMLATDPPNIQIDVLGQDMTPFERTNEKEIAEHSYLYLKDSQKKIAPIALSIQRNPQTKKAVAVLFFFPRKDAGGEPSIAAGEKRAEFRYKGPAVDIQTTFDLTRTTGKQGLDL